MPTANNKNFKNKREKDMEAKVRGKKTEGREKRQDNRIHFP